MSNIGFAVFGSPVRNECLSNGIIHEKEWDSMFYLSGPCQEILFEEGQTYYLIDQIKGGEKNISSWIIIRVEFARSYSEDRPGGFVGAAIAFTGFPHSSNLVIGLNGLFNMIVQEIDPVTRKFTSAKKELWKCKLPKLENAKQILTESPSIFNLNDSKENKAVIQLNAFDESLGWLIQNIILNPDFNSFGRILLTTNTQYAKRLTNYGFSLHTALDVFNYTNFNSIIREHLLKLKGVKDELKTLVDNKESITSAISQAKDDYNKLNERKTTLESEISDISNEIEKLKNEIEKLTNKVNNSIEKLFNDNPDFFTDKINDSVNKAIEKKNNTIEKHINEVSKLQKRNSLLAKLLTVFILFTITSTTWYFLSRLNLFKDETETITTGTYYELPSAAVTDHLNKDIWNQRQAQIQDYLSYLDTANFDSVRLLPFLTRAWDPREVLLPENTIEGSIKTIKRIQNVIQKFDVNDSWRFSCKELCNANFSDPMGIYTDSIINIRLSNRYFLLDSISRKNIVYEDFSFPKNQPDSFLVAYLLNERNVYQKAGLPYSANNPDTLLKTHFRWMVNQVSGQDINDSEAKKIKLPFVKK